MVDLNEPYHDAEQKKEGKLLRWRRMTSVHISGLWFNFQKVWRIEKKKKNSHEGKIRTVSPSLFV